MKKTKATASAPPKKMPSLGDLLREAEHLETTSFCVQTSLGALAAVEGSANWNRLIGDAFEVAGDDAELKGVLQEVLEWRERVDFSR